VLGLSEYEYYTNSPYVNFCKAEGYHDKYDHKIEAFRNLAYITHASMVGKGALSVSKLWPMWYENINTVKVVADDDMIAKIKQAHGLK
jgi:hypothetical protein